jgi:hypothetical protein
MLALKFFVSVILLIARPNVVRILLSWDGFDLIPYCLTGFYHNVMCYCADILNAIVKSNW